MKKLFSILIILISSFAAVNANIQSPAASEKLELNNGKKWKVDNITYTNVTHLKLIDKGFAAQNDISLKTYQQTANTFQNGLNKMIHDCKMKGPDHLALHKWLEPFMEQVAALKIAGTMSTAGTAFKSITLQLQQFDKYFKR